MGCTCLAAISNSLRASSSFSFFSVFISHTLSRSPPLMEEITILTREPQLLPRIIPSPLKAASGDTKKVGTTTTKTTPSSNLLPSLTDAPSPALNNPCNSHNSASKPMRGSKIILFRLAHSITKTQQTLAEPALTSHHIPQMAPNLSWKINTKSLSYALNTKF